MKTILSDRAGGGPAATPTTLGVCIPGDEGAEGRFARFEVAGDAIVVTTDPLGMFPVYTGRVANRQVVTDSIREANGGALPASLDAIGCASFVALGWPLGDHTLFEGFRVLPPGESRVRGGAIDCAVDPLAAIDRDSRRASPRTVAREVFPRIVRLVGERLRQDESTAVQLTCGQDSRVILTACLASGAFPLCATRGDDFDPEVEHARRVASLARCPHVTLREDPEDAALNWRALARTLIDRTDGMVSLWQVADAAEHASPRTSWFGGVGGAIARRFWNQKATLDDSASRESVVAALHGRLAKNPGGLLRADVFAEFDRALHARLVELAAPLADPRDLPDVVYAKERVRKWGGANTRKLPPGHQTHPVLASRTWYRAALAVPAKARVRSELLREVVHLGAPRLLSVPLFGSEWDSLPWFHHWRRTREVRRLGALRGGSTAIERGRDALRTRIAADLRAQVLDGGGGFFDLFDRAAIERALAPCEAISKDAATQALFAALTVWCVSTGATALRATAL